MKSYIDDSCERQLEVLEGPKGVWLCKAIQGNKKTLLENYVKLIETFSSCNGC